MKLRRLAAMARKETLHVLRDPRALGVGLAMPLLLLLLFGYALTLDVDRVPLLVWDQSNTPRSRDFLARFTASRYFAMRGGVEDYRAVEAAFDRREALLLVVVPADFARRLDAGRGATVQLIADGSDANTATLAMNYAEAIAQAYAGQVMVERLRRAGAQPRATPVDFQPRVWFNEELNSKNFIVPGLIAVIMMIIAALLTSLTAAREWETGTIEPLLASPLTRAEFVLGKLTPYFVIGAIDVTLSVLAGHYLFRVPLRGSVALLVAMSAVFLTGTLCLGLLISIRARNQLVASQVAFVVTFLPAFLLSGFMFDTGNLPTPLYVVSRFVPATYFIALLRAVYLKGVGIEVLATEALLLLAFTALMVTLAMASFRKRMD